MVTIARCALCPTDVLPSTTRRLPFVTRKNRIRTPAVTIRERHTLPLRLTYRVTNATMFL